MCCIFTCCGWMIDLVQRLWTFTMSCCISSAVCCVMLTASMSGIALGYNYSLAEYIDLKETNVSIYLKRGVFDDEIADDMDWRRSGRMPVAGHIKPDNLMTGSKEGDDDSLSRKSGRRLDDSVFDADDQNKYEGSLMKLTARPQIFHTNPPGTVTDDVQMADIYSKYPRGSLDNLKAIQSLIDSRRAMGTSGTTFSPLATYNVMDRNFPMYLDAHSPSGRRMMAHGPGLKPGDIYPARKAVPDEGLEAPENWVIPKRPDLFNKDQLPEYEVLSPTYPPPITMNLGPRRTSITTTTMEVKPITFVTRTTGLEILEQPTRPRIIEKFDKEPIFNDRFLLEGDQPNKNDYKQMLKVGSKSSEEEYEDEIKGLPVRKRRSIIEEPLINPSIRTKDNTSSFTDKIDINGTTVENIYDRNAYPSSSEKISDADVPKYEASDEDKSQGSNILIDRLVTASKVKLSSLTQDATQSINPISAKKIKIVTKKKPFERIIVSSKYVTNNPTKVFDTKQTTLSTAEILNSISISLGEAGLLRNPSFVKLLESTLT